MTRQALASAGAFFCVLAMGWAMHAQAQQRSIDNHGDWVVNFKTETPRPQADRRRRAPSVRNKVAEREKQAPARFADSEGRGYNPSSKVWFDGKSSCWSGEEAFTFRKGAWYYGDAGWMQLSTAWSAAEGAQPEVVSCDSDPVFATRAREYAATAATSSATGVGVAAAVAVTPQSGPEPQKAGIKTGCKKYFPSIGQMLTVPCGD